MDVFAKYVRTQHVTFKHALGMRDVFGREFHAFHELFFFLGGEAEFASDAGRTRLQPDMLVVIPKEQFHQFDVSGPEKEYHRYVVQFERVPGLEELALNALTGAAVYSDEEGKLRFFFERMAQAAEGGYDEEETKILLESALAQLLLEIRHGARTAQKHECGGMIEEALRYIGEHYLEEISVSDIAAHVRFSQTYLAHEFRKRMHIPIYQYILHKKLTHACSLIRAQVPPMQAAAMCGFREYSGFYRSYRSYFGISPAQTAREARQTGNFRSF